METLQIRRLSVPNLEDFKSRQILKSKISLNDTILDDLLQGGFATKEISELVGEASSGKTQLCLQLLVSAVWSSSAGALTPSSDKSRLRNQKAVYFYTEGGDVPLDRLREITMESCGSVKSKCKEILDNIYTEHSFVSEDDLYYRLIHLEDLLLDSEREGSPVKVIVVDSIASLFRDIDINNMGNALSSRSVYFFKISSLLKRYADVYDIAVVVTNHVVDLMPGQGSSIDIGIDHSSRGYFESFPGCAGLELISSSKSIYPALGLSWSSCINARFFLSKETVLNEQTRQTCPVLYSGPMASKDGVIYFKHILPQLRGMQVVFSPDLPQAKVHFIIRWDGCSGISKEHLKSNLEVIPM